MDITELAALVESEVAQSIGHSTGDLADARALELKYYNSEAFGNEREGESQVVSSDVFDTVEGMLPSLLRIFTASDDVVRFDPNGPEDEEQAQQQTEVVNYVFYRQNNGFLILYEWFKDALIQKNGVVKYWWEDKTTTTKSEYKGLSEGQYLKLLKGDGYGEVEVLKHETYEDETAKEEKQQQLQLALQRIGSQPLPPGEKQDFIQRITAQLGEIPVPMLHDVEVRIKKDASKICIETVPPEEFRISKKQKCISIQNTLFCSHETKKTASELREMGAPQDLIDESGPSENVERTSTEALARERFLDESQSTLPEADPSLKEIDVSDCFFRVDFDGDGVAELRHIIKVGKNIWVNEETDHICFAALTPIIMPHKWVGKSAAELVMSDQFTKSVIWRQMLNNLYLTNNPRKAVLSSASGVVQANLDDLMNSRAGGIMREYVPNAIRNEEIPFVAKESFPMLEYIDHQKETRTGQTRYSQGTDADSLNKTARGIQMIQQAGQQRGDLIARIFAETGVKDLMKGIAYYLSKYSTKAMTVRLRNEWVEIDPRDWKTQFDMTVNVGLGTGNKDIQLVHLNALGQKQMELMQTGRGHLVSDQNVYNLYKKMSEAMGFKHPEVFVADPQTVKAPPPQPNPDLIKIQAETQIDQLKLQSGEKVEQFRAGTEKELETIRSQTAIAVAQIQAEKDRQIAEMKCQHEASMKIFEENSDMQKEGMKMNMKSQADKENIMLQSDKDKEKMMLEAATSAENENREDLDGEVRKASTHLESMKNKKLEKEMKKKAEMDEMSMTVADHVGKMNAPMNQAMAQITVLLTDIKSLLQTQIQNQTKAKTMSISNVRFGEDGTVTGAKVTPTLN